LAGWDVAPLLPQLQEVPVLVARGEFDEVGMETAQQLAESLAQGSLVTLAGAGSYMHIDNWEKHLLQLEEHMCKAEGIEPPTATEA
jgi:pimeloyl-ACP methyl ester carboxylesterase